MSRWRREVPLQQQGRRQTFLCKLFPRNSALEAPVLGRLQLHGVEQSSYVPLAVGGGHSSLWLLSLSTDVFLQTASHTLL